MLLIKNGRVVDPVTGTDDVMDVLIYGDVILDVEKNIDDSDVNAFRYCGEYFDNETGTIYLRARYYAPTTGRFISRDSNVGKIGEPLSLNLYTYCHNNPIGFADFNGHERIVVSGGIDGEENFPYQFVETALKQVSDWQFDSLMKAAPNKWGGLPQIPENDITWIVADWNYPEHKLRSFRNTARSRTAHEPRGRHTACSQKPPELDSGATCRHVGGGSLELPRHAQLVHGDYLPCGHR